MTQENINIAKLLYEAYPHSDLLPIEPEKDCCSLAALCAKVTGENIGDGLFTFMVIEIVEGGGCTVAGAIRVIERTREDVEAVLEALQAASIGQKQPTSEALDKGQSAGSTVDLLEACKVLTSYTSDLLYQMNNQVDLAEIEEIQQAKEAIVHYEANSAATAQRVETTLMELSSEHPPAAIDINLLCEHGKLWMRPHGYGDACSTEGHGFPIALEIWQGRLRLVVFSDINSEDPQIIDLENAKETARLRCNWCENQIAPDSIQWKGLWFCSESCLDACRAVQ